MSHSDPDTVIRLAIAVVILKHRPRERSIASYLLDLQSIFPVVTEHKESHDWRTYALELEKQVAALKTQRDADQELLSKLPADASQAASTSDAPPPKKKTKKNPLKDQHDPEWNWDRNRAEWSRVLSSQYPSSPSLIAAYGSLNGAVASSNADLLSYASRLTDAIVRALDTIHLFLFSPWNPNPNTSPQFASKLKVEHMDNTRIALASPLLMYILQTTLPALVRTVQDTTKSKRARQHVRPTTHATADAYVHVDRALDHLLESILLPLLRAIVPLCSARLAPLVPAPPKKDASKSSRAVGKGKDKDKGRRTGVALFDLQNKTDVRTSLFALVGTSLGALDALPPLTRYSGAGVGGSACITSGIKDCLGLETIRELEALYAVPPVPAPLAPPRTLHSQQPQPASEPSPPSSVPNPTPASAPSQSRSQPRIQPRAAHESRAKRLERLAGTRAERVRALATRDAAWFLASVLNLCVTPAATVQPHGTRCDAAAGTGRLLREALLDRIGKLVRSVHVPNGGSVLEGIDQRRDGPLGDHAEGKLVVDPVCQNMLLAICERAVSHLALP